ncbi:MAG: ribosome maturation factor RimM [Bacteriovoracaceae bacterium]|jgi:16S rRNA processing protein RimM|nr:ribosome maturation factor RimM [Bacteriovoracaceae bacterium]|tara:strand:+ start:937 stop:1464 length:528 start_codon:yes stop_codon:yes gene_type:complete
MSEEKLIELGIASRPHGIKGGVQFKLYNTHDSVLTQGSVLWLYPLNEKSSLPKEGLQKEIERIHFGNKVICYLKNLKDRNELETILPFKIYYPRHLFPKLPENEWYLEDLKGLDVYDQDGYKVGLVKGYFDNGAQIVLKVKLASEVIELPFVDAFFPKVDLEKKKITMIMPEFDS